MPTRRRALTALGALTLATGLAGPALAAGSLIDLRIVDRQAGDALQSWRWRGASYVAGRPGDPYAVQLVNRTEGRLLVVLSIDGINAISGETAAIGQTGYVLAPYASADITGWRKSEAEAAAFYFTALPDSYAARTDRPAHAGVIGAAVFRERTAEPPRYWRPRQAPIVDPRDPRSGAEPSRTEPPRASRSRSESWPGESSAGASNVDAAPAPADSSSAKSSKDRAATPAPSVAAPSVADALAKRDRLGTGHGEREYSPTTRTTFERAGDAPDEVVQVRYDSVDNLVALGVLPSHRVWPAPGPEAFPNPPGFVRDPR